MSDDDDDLLALDLDDDAIQRISQVENKKLSVNSQSTLGNKSNSTVTSDKQSSESTTVRKLFANDDEDEEDLFIASQAIFKTPIPVTTQKKQPSTEIPTQNKGNDVNLNLNKENIQKTAKNSPVVKGKSTELAMLETLANHKTWKYAQSDVKKLYQLAYIDSFSVHAYTLINYFKKFFEYDLLMRPTDIGIRKLPILCVWVKELTRKPTSATVVLTDFTENIKGTITNSFLKNKSNWDYLMVGSVLLIKDVCLLKVNNNKNCYHLNINLNNIISIYYPDLNSESIEATKKFDFITFDSQKIKELIDEFENLYTKYEYKPQATATSDSILSKTSGPKNNKSVNKAAPYRIPPHLNKKQTSKPNSSVPDKLKNNTISRNDLSILNASKISTIISSDNILMQQISSNFIQENDDDDDDLLFFAENHSSTQKTQSGTVLSDEIFSQLIFGCDDQLFNDDD